MQQICKMEKLEIRAVIKYLCKTGMPPNEIHADFMETLGKQSPSYIAQRGGERALRTMDGLAAPKMPPLMKMSRSCTSWLCVRRDLRNIAMRSGHKFWGSTINPNRHIWYVKGFGEIGAANVDR